MERKYYLRGLGLGIAVTAVIMGIALSGNDAMTNDEIIARAKELGMVENTVLSGADSEDVAQGNADDENAASPSVQDDAGDVQVVEPTEQDEMQNDATDVDEQETEPEPETDVEPEQSEAEDPGDEDENVIDEEEQDVVPEREPENGRNSVNSNELITSAAVKTIVINSGDSSYTVAKKLEDVGVVASASTFDTFLCQNGYDKRLHTGTFSIPADASDEQIARIVTGME
ncbi:MAG: hypothetical protein J1F42_08830 [Lachnospiraceae bacterium]|nr:hypothetical protein [Lachnospiraceae bacterium]